MAAKNGGSDVPVSKYETEEGLKEVAAFLRGRNGMPLRPAIEVDKRVEYFKGESRKEKGETRENVFNQNTVRYNRCSSYVQHRRDAPSKAFAWPPLLFRLDAGKLERDSCV